MNSTRRSGSATHSCSGVSAPCTWSLILLVALTLTLSQGCSTRYVQVPVDPRLVSELAMPELRGPSWRDVGALAVEQQAVILECNERLRAIRGD